MAGQVIYDNHRAMRAAKKMVRKATLVFTTCIGAGLGLLRDQAFDIVVVDEASQQTEPASLVPLTKGCRKAVLVGDHVQLRPTVTPHGLSLGFDVSLFERLYIDQRKESTWGGAGGGGGGVARIMLDTQYRMHAALCEPLSREFYEGKLRTGVRLDDRPHFPSQFPWPDKKSAGRMVFIQCTAPEDIGHKSKANKGQAELTARVCRLLLSAPRTPAGPKIHTSTGKTRQSSDSKTTHETPRRLPSVAVLTPYKRQADLLKTTLSSFSSVEVCSIDGFQGREADYVVFVTVRCNPHCVIGFLKDKRRLNVALTRAKTGVIVVGDEKTLTSAAKEGVLWRVGVRFSKLDEEDDSEEDDLESKELWRRLLGGMAKVDLDITEAGEEKK